MKDWIFNQIVKFLADYLTVEVLRDWAKKVHDVLEDGKTKMIVALRAEAAKSETLIDDIAVDKLELFLDQLLPVCEIKID